MNSIETAALSIQGGLPVVLQRVPRRLDADEAARQLAALLDQPVGVVANPLSGVRDHAGVVDARSVSDETYAIWDGQRSRLGNPAAPLLVLLNAASAARLLRAAPHLASWAGGVAMPAEPLVRTARGAVELELGHNALRRVLTARPELSRGVGLIGVVIGSDRVFQGDAERTPIDQAREELDEAILYLTQLPEDPT